MSTDLPAKEGLMRPEHKEALVADAIASVYRPDGSLRLLMPAGQVIDLFYVKRRINSWHFIEVAS